VCVCFLCRPYITQSGNIAAAVPETHDRPLEDCVALLASDMPGFANLLVQMVLFELPSGGNFRVALCRHTPLSIS
jgi:hypothetical protein